MIDEGFDEPQAARIAITEVGMSWMQEELSARNMQTSLEAMLLLPPLFLVSSFIASMPKGVAALPRPKKFAARFRVMGAAAEPTFGMSSRSGFSILRDKAVTSPARSATFIIPSQRMYEPASPSMSSNAESAPSSMYRSARSAVPFMMQKSMPTEIIITKKYPNMVKAMPGYGENSINARNFCGKR